LSERRFLLGQHLQGAGHPHPDVHSVVRPRPPSRLDRALEGNDRGPEHEDRPSAADLYGADRDALRAARPAVAVAGGPELEGVPPRSEERRVGKGWRSEGWWGHGVREDGDGTRE